MAAHLTKSFESLGAPAGFWTAEDTTPAAIEQGLRGLIEQRQAESPYAPARALNLVVVADRSRRMEIIERLERVGRHHPSRTVVCAIDPERTTLDAWATMVCEPGAVPGALTVCRERVEIDLGPEDLAHLATIVDPLLVSDLATLAWSPHGHPDAVDSLTGVSDAVLLDSLDEPPREVVLARACELAARIYVVDLSWVRGAPWRERISAAFDPPAWRPALEQIRAVSVRHRADSAVAGFLLVGWLASRLGWEPGAVASRDGSLRGRARHGERKIDLRLEAVEGLDSPGLAGVTVEAASGLSISLDRGRGGLAAVRRTPEGRTLEWTVLGASRGEGGILGEGVRQALLRDPTYRPALAATRAMIS